MEKLNVTRQFPYELFNIMRNERINNFYSSRNHQGTIIFLMFSRGIEVDLLNIRNKIWQRALTYWNKKKNPL